MPDEEIVKCNKCLIGNVKSKGKGAWCPRCGVEQPVPPVEEAAPELPPAKKPAPKAKK